MSLLPAVLSPPSVLASRITADACAEMKGPVSQSRGQAVSPRLLGPGVRSLEPAHTAELCMLGMTLCAGPGCWASLSLLAREPRCVDTHNLNAFIVFIGTVGW